jgi:hypothetical protein
LHYIGGFFFMEDTSFEGYWSADGITWKGMSNLPYLLNQLAEGDDGGMVGAGAGAFVYSEPDDNYSLVLEDNAQLTAENEDDLENGWVDYVCVVDSTGEILVRDVEVNSYDPDTRVLNCSEGELFEMEDNFIVFGKYATTHSQLPDVCERYLADYMALRIQMRDSSTESADTSPVLMAIEQEILDAVANLEEDLIAIPILDSSMLNYSDDL